MYNSQAERDRVDREQQLVKEKGKEALEAARKLRRGEVEVELPSTEEVEEGLKKGEESLERFQSSERGQQLGPQGQKIVEDLKRVLTDQERLLQDKNQGDLLQNIIRDIWALLQELSDDPKLRELFEEWQSDLTSLFSSGDFVQFFQQGGELFTSLKDTEEFLELMSQLIDLLKVVVAEKTELTTEKDPLALSEYRHLKEIERRRVEAELRVTLRALAYNDVWSNLVCKGKEISVQAQVAGEETKDKAKEAYYHIRESRNFQNLLQDFKLLLQRLVGSRRSVDLLFDSAKAAVEDILNDQELREIIHCLHIKLSQLTENPALFDDRRYQDDITELAERADKAVERLRNNRNVITARKESDEVLNAIKNEPESAQFLMDIKNLWRDISSDKPGEVVDADVLRSIRQMVVPLLLEHLNNVPLPAIHDRAEFLGKYDYTIDEMKISLPELIPENIHVRFEFEMDTNPLQLESTNQHTYLYLQASNIQLHLRDAHFCYNRLSVPKISDSGIFDVDTSGNGMTIWMKMEIKTATKDGQTYQYLDVLKSNVRIQKLSITFKESKHDKLYEFLTHLFQNRIKKGVIELIQEKLQLFGSYFSEQFLVLIEQARLKSEELSRLAKNKAEEARRKLETFQISAKETIEESKYKQEGKGLVGSAGEKAQSFLDDQKLKVEEKKKETELERELLGSRSRTTGLSGSQQSL